MSSGDDFLFNQTFISGYFLFGLIFSNYCCSDGFFWNKVCVETIVVLCLCCSYVSGHHNEELLYCVDGLMGVFLVLPGW